MATVSIDALTLSTVVEVIDKVALGGVCVRGSVAFAQTQALRDRIATAADKADGGLMVELSPDDIGHATAILTDGLEAPTVYAAAGVCTRCLIRSAAEMVDTLDGIIAMEEADDVLAH